MVLIEQFLSISSAGGRYFHFMKAEMEADIGLENHWAQCCGLRPESRCWDLSAPVAYLGGGSSCRWSVSHLLLPGGRHSGCPLFLQGSANSHIGLSELL